MLWVVVWRLLGMMFCGLTQADGSTRPETLLSAVGERSRLFQLTVDVHALTPSWWIVQRQRCTTDNDCCGPWRHTLNCRVYTALKLALVISEVCTRHGEMWPWWLKLKTRRAPLGLGTRLIVRGDNRLINTSKEHPIQSRSTALNKTDRIGYSKKKRNEEWEDCSLHLGDTRSSARC